ncbi:MAG: Dipeptide transport system permease protein DppB [Firmicutes bacterium]|nr:Dipeptide transport system permease protein DppB [Bacillota bacterium]
MLGYLTKRLASAVPVIIGVTLLVFLMLHMVPGDPAEQMLGEMAVDKTAVANLRQQMGLNDPLAVQYGHFLGNILHGNLGTSMLAHRSVMDMIGKVLPSTFYLTLAGLGVAIVLGTLLGIAAAVRQNTWLDTSSMVLALLGVSMPSFWLGLLLVFTFSLRLGWFPATGSGGWERMVMPAFTLGFGAAAVIARLVRASMLEILRLDFIRVARAKGLSEHRVIYRHALKNALIPVLTMVGLEFGRLLGGTVVIETVFARPGIGRLIVDSILKKDFQVVQGAVLLSAVFYVAINLLVDMSYALIDPRIRYQ